MAGAPGWSDIVSMLVSLTAILLLLGFAAFVIRKLRGAGPLRSGPWQGGPARGRIEILAARQIGWQCSLMIVEADGNRFLIGAGRNGLTQIGALTQPGAPETAV